MNHSNRGHSINKRTRRGGGNSPFAQPMDLYQSRMDSSSNMLDAFNVISLDKYPGMCSEGWHLTTSGISGNASMSNFCKDARTGRME